MNFEQDALPLLLALSKHECDKDFPVLSFLKDQGMSKKKLNHVVQILIEGNYMQADLLGTRGNLLGTANTQIGLEGLRQLNLWPSDNERGLYLIEKIAVALEEISDESATPEEQNKLKTAAQTIRKVSSSVAAGLITHGITG